MTITYSSKVFLLLVRWKGSVWKTVWKQLLIWVLTWYLFYFILTFGLTPAQQKRAADVVNMFNTFCTNLPLVFILGFYVGQVVTRWWNQVQLVPWPDEVAVQANFSLTDEKKNQKPLRESVVRWLILSEAMTLRQLSPRIYKRFPQLDNFVTAGLMTLQELALIRKTPCPNVHWQMPLDWIVNKVIIPCDAPPNFKIAFLSSLNAYRTKLQNMFTYDWVVIPLVYTQTVAIVVYGYFVFAVVGHQYVGKPVDLYAPWLSILQFLFYVGWFNVARDLMHPWGEDDDDVELNWILDRNAAVAYSLVTYVTDELPDIVVDEGQRRAVGLRMLHNLTYSTAATNGPNHPPKMRSTAAMKEADQNQVPGISFDDKEKSKCFMDLLSRVHKPLNYF